VLARVCPAQLDQLAEYGGEFLAEMGMSELVKFVGDAELTPGDVVLVSRNGRVDASIQTQIDNVIAAVTGKPRGAE
jgi:flagellar biosynthesis/type III secretory pathway protein FliH